ncbi:hypothetical protein ACROYT_G013560 [Oculina patagonica]
MIWQRIQTFVLGVLVLVTFSEALNSTVTSTNKTTGCVLAERTKWSAAHSEPGVCTPYQATFPNGYCKGVIGYQRVYGTNQNELQHSERKMLRYHVAKSFLVQSRRNSTEQGRKIVLNHNSFVVRQSCLDMVDDVYCHHYFKRCYISSRPPPICREACEDLFFKVCDREFKMVVDFTKSTEAYYLRYYFELINCTTLPFQNDSSDCYYPDKIRDKLNILESEDCFYGDGRGYRGNRSVTVSGTVRWEYCDVPKCPERPPSSPPTNFRGHNMSSTSIKLTWEDVPKDLIHGVFLGYHVVCERPNTLDRHFVDLSPSEHKWVSEGLQKYTNYSCWLRAYNNYGNGTWSEELVILTDEDAPDAPPESLNAWNLSSTSLHIQWDPILFEYRNGKILHYKVELNAEEQTRERQKIIKYTESTSLTLEGLQKYSKYVISVSGITRRGNGPARSKVVQTDEDVPDRPPKDITVVSIGTDTVQVDWSPVSPEYTNGEVLGYKVLFSDVNDTSRANSSLVSPKETHSWIKGLKANTNYSFQVLAFTAKGNGPKSMSYFVRTFSDPQMDPRMGTDTSSTAKMGIIVAAVFSAILAFGVVFLVIYLVQKKRISRNSDNGNGCSVTPYAVSSPDWLNEIINTHSHGYDTIDDDNVATTTREPNYINIAADGSLDLPPHLKNIVTEFELLYENTRYNRLHRHGRRRSVEGGTTATMEHKKGCSVDLGELRGFVGALQGNICSIEMTEMGTVEQRCRRRFSVDMGQVREFIALREMKTSTKEEKTSLADQPEAKEESRNDKTC